MRELGKKNVIGILINTVDYETALDVIFRAARERRGTAVSALAVHGVMSGVLNSEHKFRLNHFDLLVPDGQPVRWVLNWLHKAHLPERVYGPTLTLKVCERTAVEGHSIYLYGSTAEILAALARSLHQKFPGIKIAGAEPSKLLASWRRGHRSPWLAWGVQGKRCLRSNFEMCYRCLSWRSVLRFPFWPA
jgi:UDP-N-acetyl-D-mannosaminuronic acid transferase (WecB/TagA/CpsF family)